MRWLVMAAIVLAGCSEPVSRVGDHVHGGFHECPDGTRLDPGDYAEHHQEGFDIASKFPAPGEPARIGLDAPAQAQAYDALEIVWDITPARQGHHAQATELRLVGPTEVLGTHGSTMVPRAFRASWMPVAPGTYTLEAWAIVEGAEVSTRAEIAVTEVPPTDVVHTIRITAGPLAAVDPGVVTIQPGDTVRWVNEDLVARQVELRGPEPTTFEVGARSSSDLVLHRLGEHDFTATDVLAQRGGRIVVSL